MGLKVTVFRSLVSFRGGTCLPALPGLCLAGAVAALLCAAGDSMWQRQGFASLAAGRHPQRGLQLPVAGSPLLAWRFCQLVICINIKSVEVLEGGVGLWQDGGRAWEHSQAAALVLLRFAITLWFSLSPVFLY